MSTVHCKSHEGGCQLHLQALAATLGQHVQSSQAAVLWESLGQGLRVHREVLQQIALFQLGDASLCRHQLPAQQAPQMQLLPICAFALQTQSLKNPETLSMAVSCMHSMRATLVKALAQSCCSPPLPPGARPRPAWCSLRAHWAPWRGLQGAAAAAAAASLSAAAGTASLLVACGWHIKQPCQQFKQEQTIHGTSMPSSNIFLRWRLLSWKAAQGF